MSPFSGIVSAAPPHDPSFSSGDTIGQAFIATVKHRPETIVELVRCDQASGWETH